MSEDSIALLCLLFRQDFLHQVFKTAIRLRNELILGVRGAPADEGPELPVGIECGGCAVCAFGHQPVSNYLCGDRVKWHRQQRRQRSGLQFFAAYFAVLSTPIGGNDVVLKVLLAPAPLGVGTGEVLWMAVKFNNERSVKQSEMLAFTICSPQA
jgi:hypothetical protein